MKFCPVVPEICHGQVHVPKKERKRRIIINNNNNNDNKKWSKNNKSPKRCLRDLINWIFIELAQKQQSTCSHVAQL